MYHYTDRELVQVIHEHHTGEHTRLYWWYRDCCLDAEQRGLASINRNPEHFWCFNDRVTFTEAGQRMLNQILQTNP